MNIHSFFISRNIATSILVIITLLCMGCQKNLPDPNTNVDINELIVPQSFNYETADDLVLTITDPEDMVKYEVYTFNTDQAPEVVYTATDTLIMVENSNQLITQGLINNGRWSENLNIPAHQQFLYLRRFKDGAYSGIFLEITGNSLEYNHTGSTLKTQVAEDVIYIINGSGDIGYFRISDQEYIEIKQVPHGSSAMAVDKANNALYYIEDADPEYNMMSLDLTTYETSIIGPMNKRFARMDYRNDEGLLYVSSGGRTITYDPFAASFISSYYIKDGVGGGDICFGPGEYLYAVSRGLFKVMVTGERTSYTTILNPLEEEMTAACFASDGYIYAASKKDVYRIDPSTGASDFLFELDKRATDFGILLKDTEDSNPDQDGDGVPNESDEYPEDPNKAYNSWYPGKNSFGTLAYEDLWPYRGDYDFNDIVIDYKFKHIKNAANLTVGMDVNFILRAIGGSTRLGFGLQLSLLPSLISSVVSDYTFSGENINVESNGLESDQDLATILVFNNAFDILKHPGSGIGINTNNSNNYVEPEGINLEITFSEGVEASEIGIAPYNTFIFKTDERGLEIHLPGYPPTDLADRDYFGTGNDATNLEEGYYYKTQKGLPWGMNVPTSFVYPLEKTSISEGYLKFKQWASSGGFSSMDWYLDLENNRNKNKLFIKN